MEGKKFRVEAQELPEGYNPDLQKYKVFVEAPKSMGSKEVEIENISIKGVIDFYLKNEDQILQSKRDFNNEEAFEHSTSGKAKQARMDGYTM